MNQLAATLLFAAFLVAGCARPDPTPRFTPAWEKFDRTKGNWLTTRKGLLVADCQIHNLYSKALPERNISAESLAGTAIRPPQLDLFSPDVLAWILENGAPDAEVILHLGDALNVATTGEFDRFLAVMEGAKVPWFMAPGNHDSFYMGVYAARNKELLADASYGSGESLFKDRFIRLYVSALLRQADAGCAALADALLIEVGPDKTLAEVADQIPDSFEWHAEPNTPGLLDAICWKIDTQEQWRSYILQSIDAGLPESELWETRVLLLDSCQYTRRPEMVPNAWRSYPFPLNCGLTGEMQPDQLRKIREWIEAFPKTRNAVLMCHHPFEHLAPRTRTNLGWLWREERLGLFVSAHTHAGYYAHHDLGGHRDNVELNIGSTSDWPMEWRTLQSFVNLEERKIYLESDRSTLVDVLHRRGGFFDPGWEIPLDAPDDYRRYKQGESANDLLVSYYLGYHLTPYWLPPPRIVPTRAAKQTEEQVKDTLLWTYFRLVMVFPTDPGQGARWPRDCTNDKDVVNRIHAISGKTGQIEKKIALLQQLEVFEGSRHSHDPETGQPTDEARAHYKISQAVWASRFMAARGRRLRVEDELIRVAWDESHDKTAARLKSGEGQATD